MFLPMVVLGRNDGTRRRGRLNHTVVTKTPFTRIFKSRRNSVVVISTLVTTFSVWQLCQITGDFALGRKAGLLSTLYQWPTLEPVLDHDESIPLVPESMLQPHARVWQGASTRVRVWYPQRASCQGIFRSKALHQSVPWAILREAAVDFRHTSIAEYRTRHPNVASFRRIVLLVSIPSRPDGERVTTTPIIATHGNRTSPWSSVSLRGPKKHIAGLTVSIDYIFPDLECSQQCSRVAPNTCSASEWQVMVTIRPRDETLDSAALDKLLTRFGNGKGTYIRLRLMAKIDGKPKVFKARIDPGCVAGLLPSTRFVPDIVGFPERTESCDEAKKAIALVGGSLFGQKRDSPEGRNELGHFIARSLLGHVRFDAVAAGVLVRHTMSEIAHVCGKDPVCRMRHFHENVVALHEIARDVDAVLFKLGVPADVASKVVLFPFCRLGSDSEGYEAGSPCRWSHYRGQYPYNYYSYTLFSPYAKWVVSMDVDESLVDESLQPSSNTPQPSSFTRASDRFDEIPNPFVPGALWFRWLDFRMQLESNEKFTQGLLAGQQPQFVSLSTEPLNRSKCYSPKVTRSFGKSALSCKAGFGFCIHNVVVLRHHYDLMSRYCAPRIPWNLDNSRLSSLIVMHGRGTPRFGMCEYAPPPAITAGKPQAKAAA